MLALEAHGIVALLDDVLMHRVAIACRKQNIHRCQQ